MSQPEASRAAASALVSCLMGLACDNSAPAGTANVWRQFLAAQASGILLA